MYVFLESTVQDPVAVRALQPRGRKKKLAIFHHNIVEKKKLLWNRDSKPGGEFVHVLFVFVLPLICLPPCMVQEKPVLTRLSLIETTSTHKQEDPAMLESEYNSLWIPN